jgi:cytidylate kinase
MKATESPGSNLLVERQMLLARVRNQTARPGVAEPASPIRFVTITRDVGALGDQVATALAEDLHWHLYDREIVDFIAQDSHVRQDLVRGLDERAQGMIHDTVQRFLLTSAGISFGNQEYHESLLKTLALVAARGEAVIVGRGGAYALQGEPGLHVRIFASPEVRARRLAERWQTSLEEARRRMEKIDAERRSFRLQHFRRHVDELRFFNAIFNTDDTSVDQVVRAIAPMITGLGRRGLQTAALPSNPPLHAEKSELRG